MAKQHPFLPGIELEKHHLIPRVKQGHATPCNILRLWSLRHDHWHHLFNQDTLEQSIRNLPKVYAFKSTTASWKLVFGDKTLLESRTLLMRVRSIKKSLGKKKSKQTTLFPYEPMYAGAGINWNNLGFDRNPTFLNH